jgi:3-oxoacyl-[acyl-carrier protein] reductase
LKKELAGRTALVTGSGRNLGRAILLELAAMGANVIVNTRSNVEEARAVASEAERLGVRSLIVVGDISSHDTIDEIVRKAVAEFGGIDVSVSNAALRPRQSFFDTPVDDWLRILDMQLNASFRLAKAVVPGMIQKQWGRIIHITGPDAFLGVPNRAHNVTAKGGLRALTKCLAIELGPYGITVNDVAPGVIDTERNDESHPQITLGTSESRSHFVDTIPVRRLGTADDVAYACRFLASPRAGFYTGTVMCCFGGQWNVP